MHIRTALAAAAVATLFSAPTFGAAIVNFNGNLPDTGNAGTLGLAGTTSTAGGGFSAVVAFADNGRNGPTVAGFPKLTAASSYYAAGATGAGARNLAYRTQENPDRLQMTIPVGTGATGNTELDLLLLVYKQDFAALSTEQIIFDAESSMSMDKASLPVGATVNYVVKNGNTFYMSTRQFTNADPAAPLVLSNLPTQTWVTFDPTNGGDGNIRSLASANGGGQTYSFNDVQAVGVYWETSFNGSRTVATANWVVNASAVPEPGSIAVFGGALAFGILGRRKHA